MAHRKGSGKRRWHCQLSASRSPPNLCPALPRLWRRVRTDSVPLGTCFGSDHGTLSRLQAEDSISRKRSHRYRAKCIERRSVGEELPAVWQLAEQVGRGSGAHCSRHVVRTDLTSELRTEKC